MNAFLTNLVNHLLTFLFLGVLFAMSIQGMDHRHNFALRSVALVSFSLLLCALFAFVETRVLSSLKPYLGLILDAMLYLVVILASIFLVSTNRSTRFFLASVVLLCEYPIELFTDLTRNILSSVNIQLTPYWVWLLSLLFFFVDLFYAYFAYLKPNRGNVEKVSSHLVSVFFVLFLFFIVLFKASKIAVSSKALSFSLVLSIVELFYVVLMTSLFFTLMRNEENETNLSVLKQMWNEDRKQYQIQKENMDIINIKCHDLRHQIQNFRSQGASSQGEAGVNAMMKQLENSIYIYDAVIQTGNEVLDVILSNVSLRANQKKIQLTAMVDGKSVLFLEEVDTYSLFGNMLDNALEYEEKIDDKSKCFISITVKRQGDFTHIHCENYFEEKKAPLRNKDGSFKTSKGDIVNHGYGIKSMELIVKKYGGQFDTYISDGMFQTDLLIPYREKEKTK